MRRNLIHCKFSQNKGTSVNIDNKFNIKKQSSMALLQFEGHVSISKCNFEIDADSKSSIYYLGGNNAVSFKIDKCIFVGKLSEGAHHIDGKLMNKNPQKLIINSYKFSSNYMDSLNIDKNFLFIDMKKQVLNYDYKDERSLLNKLKIIATNCTAACTLIIIAAVFIHKKKLSKQESENFDENEMSFDNSEVNDLTQKLI